MILIIPTPATLAEFVLARIAEDKAAARAAVEPRAAAGPWITGKVASHLIDTVVYRPSPYNPELIVHAASTEFAGRDAVDVAAHIARWDPARVLAECEAKRKLVRLAQHMSDNAWQDGDQRAVTEFRAGQILRFLALPYSEHPDYPPDTDSDWKS